MKPSNKVMEWMLIVAVTTTLLPAALVAQGRGKGGGHGRVPPGHLPPPGTCRVWHDGLPPGRQSSPTNCDAARREAYYTGGRVIYGSVEYRDRRGHHRYPRRRDYPVVLPEMIWGVSFGRGVAVVEVHKWIAVGHPRTRVVDANRDGRPELIIWYDDGGREVQRWLDDNHDGRADRVAIYDGARVQLVIR